MVQVYIVRIYNKKEIPLELNESSTSSLKLDSAKANILKKCSLIVLML
jgi:hypothetical protein